MIFSLSDAYIVYQMTLATCKLRKCISNIPGFCNAHIFFFLLGIICLLYIFQIYNIMLYLKKKISFLLMQTISHVYVIMNFTLHVSSPKDICI